MENKGMFSCFEYTRREIDRLFLTATAILQVDVFPDLTSDEILQKLIDLQEGV